MSDHINHQEPVYHIPQGMRVYAIGDLHGYGDALDNMHEAITFDLIDNPPESVHIVYLGDYIDRGPDSQGVIERLIERRDRGDGIAKTFLLGNHENALLSFLKDSESQFGSAWLEWGGMETLASYGISCEGGVLLPAEKQRAAEELARAMSQEHIEFLKNLELYVEIGDYLFVHGGRHPQKRLKNHRPEEIHFMREPFLSWHQNPDYKPFSKRVVHGHTITESRQPEIFPHRINIDTGLYEGGSLTAAVLEQDNIRFLQVK